MLEALAPLIVSVCLVGVYYLVLFMAIDRWR